MGRSSPDPAQRVAWAKEELRDRSAKGGMGCMGWNMGPGVDAPGAQALQDRLSPAS